MRVIEGGKTPVRAWREYLGLTQEAVALKAGITQAALSQIESGSQKIRKATREKLAQATGIAALRLQ
jgi:transcriptional regulator with XRE-family HTH domain